MASSYGAAFASLRKLFATTDFAEDREGLSIFAATESAGWLLVSDQSARRCQVYRREGVAADPHRHERVGFLEVATVQSDGSEIVSLPMGPRFPRGVFLAMSDDRTFQVYDLREIEARIGETARRLQR